MFPTSTVVVRVQYLHESFETFIFHHQERLEVQYYHSSNSACDVLTVWVAQAVGLLVLEAQGYCCLVHQQC